MHLHRSRRGRQHNSLLITLSSVMLRLRAAPHTLLEAILAGINSFTVEFAGNYGGRVIMAEEVSAN